MEHLEYSTLEHLVFNTSFKRWVLTNTEADAAYWNAWLKTHPDKKLLVNEARAVIQALSIDFTTHSTQKINKEISIILQKLDESFPPEIEPEKKNSNARFVRMIRSAFFYKAAAAVIILSLATYLVIGYLGASKTDAVSAFLTKENSAGYDKIENSTTAPMLLRLPDGSEIILRPNSNVVYAKKFASLYREVYLTGEAFFEVAKDPTHPFFVYTSNIVTRVLGTSFTIRSFPADKRATVIVKTGRVTVFKRENFKSAAAAVSEQGAKIITANQQVIFNTQEKDLHRTIIEKPIIIAPLPPKQNLVFSATPVSEVFTRLQQLYGITIVYDANILANCSLSASLEDETFYEKLDMICTAINAQYTLDDGNIIISSKGCK